MSSRDHRLCRRNRATCRVPIEPGTYSGYLDNIRGLWPPTSRSRTLRILSPRIAVDRSQVCNYRSQNLGDHPSRTRISIDASPIDRKPLPRVRKRISRSVLPVRQAGAPHHIGPIGATEMPRSPFEHTLPVIRGPHPATGSHRRWGCIGFGRARHRDTSLSVPHGDRCPDTLAPSVRGVHFERRAGTPSVPQKHKEHRSSRVHGTPVPRDRRATVLGLRDLRGRLGAGEAFIQSAQRKGFAEARLDRK
ncbi:hypothetical protein C8Q79DRAFT_105433 [Trametes meyenii]|nr:hypothetical protein C8Q79DRAFT_105433 [Trametes meyenii]